MLSNYRSLDKHYALTETSRYIAVPQFFSSSSIVSMGKKAYNVKRKKRIKKYIFIGS